MTHIDLTTDMDLVRTKINEMRRKLMEVCTMNGQPKVAAFYDGYFDAVIDLLDNTPTIAP